MRRRPVRTPAEKFHHPSGIFRCEVIMLNIAAYKPGSLAVCLCLLLAACATPTQEDTHASVKAAEATFTRFVRDPDMRWMQENLPKARGVMICPRILQAGFVFGGSGGRCVVVALRGTTSGWSGPAFYRIATGSFGLQAGAQESEMVVLVMTEKALTTMLTTSFKLGGDVSLAAGPIGAGAGAPITADMVSFVRSRGLYGGINVDGSVITVDDNANQAFYGRQVTPVDILVKGSARSAMDDSLTRAISRAASREAQR
jgi:lipid-binding SYLF domain-containing protein